MIDGWWKRVQVTAVKNTPGWAVLGVHTANGVSHGAQATEQPSSAASTSVLPPASFLVMDCKLWEEINPSFPRLFLATVFTKQTKIERFTG